MLGDVHVRVGPADEARSSPTLSRSLAPPWAGVKGQAAFPVWAAGRDSYLLSEWDTVVHVVQQDLTYSLSFTGGVKVLEHIQEVRAESHRHQVVVC